MAAIIGAAAIATASDSAVANIVVAMVISIMFTTYLIVFMSTKVTKCIQAYLLVSTPHMAAPCPLQNHRRTSNVHT